MPVVQKGKSNIPKVSPFFPSPGTGKRERENWKPWSVLVTCVPKYGTQTWGGENRDDAGSEIGWIYSSSILWINGNPLDQSIGFPTDKLSAG